MLSTTKRATSGRHAQQQRGSDRFDTEMPVEIDGAKGVTRNISATGVYFETTQARDIGTPVKMTIEVTMGGERMKLVCEGLIVRVDQKRGGKVGLAAKLRKSFFSTEDAPTDISGLDTVPASLND